VVLNWGNRPVLNEEILHMGFWAAQQATAGVPQATVISECSSTQPPAFSPQDDEVRAHRRFVVPFISYPYDTKLSDEWGLIFTVRINEHGRVTCYKLKDEFGRTPVLNAERQAEIQELGTWQYAPFTRGGEAVSAVVSERVNEQEAVKQHVPLPQVPLSKVHISLERTGCFGTCPSYKVDIYGDGRAVYSGRGFVDVLGTHSYRISLDDVAWLVESLRGKDIWSLRPAYVAQITDNPTYVLTLDMGGTFHSLEDYVGESVGMPTSVSEFEGEVDKVAHSAMWLHLSGQALGKLRAEHFNFRSRAGAQVLARAVADAEAHNDKAMLALLNLGAPIDGAGRSTSHFWDTPGPIIEEALRNQRAILIDPLISRGALKTNGKPDQKKIDSAFRAAIVGGSLELVKRLWRVVGSNSHPSLTFDSVTDDEKPVHKKAPVTLLLARPTDQVDHWEGLAIAKWLVERGCDIKAARADGDTLLHIAAESDDADLVRYVVSKGVDASTPGQLGLPALSSAQDEDVAMVLLEAGTDMSRMDDTGHQFRRYAEDNHWLRVLTWLRAHNE
jgi:hypothetical protein